MLSRVTSGCVLMVGATERLAAQKNPVPHVRIERLEGDWVRVDATGSGDFGGLASTFTRGSLTPQGGAAMEAGQRQAAAPRGPAFAENARHDAGVPSIVVSRPCGAGPFGRGALGINPDSTGRVENGELVVDTIGITRG